VLGSSCKLMSVTERISGAYYYQDDDFYNYYLLLDPDGTYKFVSISRNLGRGLRRFNQGTYLVSNGEVILNSENRLANGKFIRFKQSLSSNIHSDSMRIEVYFKDFKSKSNSQVKSYRRSVIVDNDTKWDLSGSPVEKYIMLKRQSVSNIMLVWDDVHYQSQVVRKEEANLFELRLLDLDSQNSCNNLRLSFFENEKLKISDEGDLVFYPYQTLDSNGEMQKLVLRKNGCPSCDTSSTFNKWFIELEDSSELLGCHNPSGRSMYKQQ